MAAHLNYNKPVTWARSNDVENKIDGKYFRPADHDVCTSTKKSSTTNGYFV